MKLQLSTLLLLVGFVALSVGWLTDRQRLNRQVRELQESREQRDEQIYLGSVMMGSSTGKFDLLDRFDFDDLNDELSHINNDPKFRQVLSEACITELLNIFEHQSEIELVGTMITGSYDARLSAREAIYLLKCENVNQLFETAKSLDEFSSPDFYPAFHDPSSEEYKSLYKFVSDTIAIKDQMYVRGFENGPKGK
jgi:hypothetical protein